MLAQDSNSSVLIRMVNQWPDQLDVELLPRILALDVITIPTQAQALFIFQLPGSFQWWARESHGAFKSGRRHLSYHYNDYWLLNCPTCVEWDSISNLAWIIQTAPTFILYIYLERERERDSTSRGGAEKPDREREREREREKIPSSTEPDVGHEPMNCEIMTWAKTNSWMLNWLSHPGVPDSSHF